VAEASDHRPGAAVRKPGQWLVGLALAAALTGYGGMKFLDGYVNRMAFYPTPGVDVDHQSLGRSIDSLYLSTTDGLRLHAFFIPEPSSQHALLYLHGNAGNASHRLPAARDIADLGVNVLLLDYRGYGLSEGQPSEAGVYVDAETALNYLNDQGYRDGQVIVFGRSLGGAVAIDLASKRSVGGLLLCSTFSSGADMARAIGLGWLAPLMSGRFDSLSKISAIDVPLLAMHGTDDEVVPHGLGRRLFDAAPDGRKQWLDLPGAGHNDVMQAGADRFWPAVRSYLLRVGAIGAQPASGS
jgi:fermentation-respiration switch protein FrsA (DUF1100 family)